MYLATLARDTPVRPIFVLMQTLFASARSFAA